MNSTISGLFTIEPDHFSPITHGEPTQDYRCNPESAIPGNIRGYGILERSPRPTESIKCRQVVYFFLPVAQPLLVVAESVSPVDEVNVAVPTPHFDPALGEFSVKV